MPLQNYFTTQTLFPQSTWQSTWETLQTGFATMTGALWQGAQAVFNPPEEPFFMQVQEEESYQVYSNWCSEVRRAERLLQAQLAKKQLSPEGLRKALLAPLDDLSASMVSPLYYYLRLKKLEQSLTEKNYPKAFKEVTQEAGHRLREAIKAEPELVRDYFYQDIINHLIEHSAQWFTSSKLLNWLSFYEELVEAALYQPVKQALEDFVKLLHPTGEIAARHYKTLIAQLNGLFQATSVAENSVEASPIEKSSSLNFRFLALAGLALTGGYIARQANSSYVEQGLTEVSWQSLKIIGAGFSVWSVLDHGSFRYGQGYSLSWPILVGSLSTLFPLAVGQVTLNANAAFELSTLDGTNGFVTNGGGDGCISNWPFASGDINGDGKADMLIGAYCDSPGGRIRAGASYVVFGHTGGFPMALELSSVNGKNGFVINGVAAYDDSGYSIASGDINGDGVADILIGANQASPGGRTYAGASYVVFGHHTEPFMAALELSSLNGTNGFVINGVTAYDYSGYSLTSGDINADGVDDVLIVAGSVSYVVFGHTGVFPAALELSSLNGTNGFAIDYSGTSLASGDINADGVDDVLIGNSMASPDSRDGAGVSYVVFGQAGSFPAMLEVLSLNGTNGFIINGVNTYDSSGCSIASGDVNADGADDVLIGALGASPGGRIGTGASYVVFGHTGIFPAVIELAALDSTNGFVINGVSAGDHSGCSIASGDVNADGADDVLIGAIYVSPDNRAYAGASYVVLGRHTEPFPRSLELSSLSGGSTGFVINGVNAMDSSGSTIASGDINGDDVADIWIGAPGAGNSENYVNYIGASYVIFTNARHRGNSSKQIEIAVGVTLAVLGLFAIGSGVGYKFYQRRKAKAQQLDLEMRGMHLSRKERRAIEHFVLINDLDAHEAQALYEQTGIRVEIPEGEHCQKVVLGEGEFGKVKLAYDRNAQEFVGVKKIKGVKAMEASEQERLIHERLSGLPHILPLLYSKITEDSQQKPAFYQFIRLAGFGNGERLRQQLTHITDRELKRKLIQHVGQGLLIGVAGMHDKNTYHLDIKPQNYMLTINGMVYVIDFGCTREFKSDESCWIEDGGTGDVSCFSPERLANFRYVLKNKGQTISPASEVVERYDAEKADAWSVGLALLELMIGRYPLSDDNIGFTSRLNYWDSISMGELLKNTWAAVVHLSGLFSSQQGQTLVKIVEGLLAVDPAQRLTVREALKHPLFTEPVFKPTELKEQFRALNELGITDLKKSNNNNIRRDGSLYSATVASRAEDPNYGQVLSMALKA